MANRAVAHHALIAATMTCPRIIDDAIAAAHGPEADCLRRVEKAKAACRQLLERFEIAELTLRAAGAARPAPEIVHGPVFQRRVR